MRKSLRRGETDLLRDAANRFITCKKQLLCLFESRFNKGVPGRFSVNCAETKTKQGGRNAKMIGDVVDRNAVLEIFAHESQSVVDEMSGRWNRSCRIPLDDFLRLDVDGLAGFACAHQPVEFGRCTASHFGIVGLDAGNLRPDSFAEELVVVHSEDGHLVGYLDLDAKAGLHHIDGRAVAIGHQCGRLRKPADPAVKIGLLDFVRERRDSPFRQTKVETAVAKHFPVAFYGSSHEGKRAEVPFGMEIVRANPANGDIVVLHQGDGRVGMRRPVRRMIVQNQRNAAAHEVVESRRTLGDACNNAVDFCRVCA